MGNQIIQKQVKNLQDCCTIRENKVPTSDFDSKSGESFGKDLVSSDRSRLYVHTPKRNLDKVLKTLVKKSISEKAGIIDIN